RAGRVAEAGVEGRADQPALAAGEDDAGTERRSRVEVEEDGRGRGGGGGGAVEVQDADDAALLAGVHEARVPGVDGEVGRGAVAGGEGREQLQLRRLGERPRGNVFAGRR